MTATLSNTDPHAPERRGAADRLFVALQYLLPQHALSRLAHWLTRRRLGRLTGLLIRRFVRHYRIDLGEAAQPSVAVYADFNAFFTRALRADARPIAADPDSLVSPVDGCVSQIGDIRAGRIVQAKGQTFSVAELLGDSDAARAFDGGRFATLYLSPRDYHRIHMPWRGRLSWTLHIPGRLFSVNPVTTAAVPRLFARNERLVCWFETARGPLALVLVGAIFVGSIETVWAGRVTPPRGRALKRVDYSGGMPIWLERDAELGRFNMGSTVILLLPTGAADWSPDLAPGTRVRRGMRLDRAVSG